MRLILIIILFFLSCSHQRSDQLVCMKIDDRNGFSEMINSEERLSRYANTDFLSVQPYQKVIRVYKTYSGKKLSKITSYHENGMIAEYLEALDARAFGKYKKWHENGKLAVDANVIEGSADLSHFEKKTWIFDKECIAYDNMGNLISKFYYIKGKLNGNSYYYFPSGNIKKIVPYKDGSIDGEVILFNEEKQIISKSFYVNGKKENEALSYFEKDLLSSKEVYKKGFLMEGIYFSKDQKELSRISKGNGEKTIFKNGKLKKIVQYEGGIPKGKAEVYKKGKLFKEYFLENGKKNGKEIQYYKDGKTALLSINWLNDIIHGKVKTYYSNGNIESEKEFSQNKKHGLCSAWYLDGKLMFLEEYVRGRLNKGIYYKNNEKEPVSSIDKGKGIATLFSKDGTFLRSIKYKDGMPQDE